LSDIAVIALYVVAGIIGVGVLVGLGFLVRYMRRDFKLQK
jgi:hypothetical protein